MDPTCAVTPAMLVSNKWDEHFKWFRIDETCFVRDRLYVCVKLLYVISFQSTTEGKTHQKPMTYVYVYNLYVQNEWITSQARAVLPTVVTGNQM